METDDIKPSVAAMDNIESDKPSVIQYDLDLDQKTQQQQNLIEKEINSTQPLITEKISTMRLKNEYAVDDRIYQAKIEELTKRYKYFRRTRGDGNCFYRAFGFGYLEANLKNSEELERFRCSTNETKEQLIKLGYQDYIVGELRDFVIEIFDYVQKEGIEAKLVEKLCEFPTSEYMIVYLRLFTSAYLQMNREFFENFIEDGKTIKEFCSTEVEPMARESDNIHIIALTKATLVPIRIIYMDRSEQSGLTIHDFSTTDDEINKDFEPMITMLYRPGHYDLLYEN